MKTQTSSRSRRSAAQWASLVEQYESSSLPAADFCEQVGVPLARLKHWCGKLRAADGRSSGGFTPIRLRAVAAPPPAQAVSTIEVQLSNGRIVRVLGDVDVQALRAVLQAAEEGAAC
jgi:hypothetical protein